MSTCVKGCQSKDTNGCHRRQRISKDVCREKKCQGLSKGVSWFQGCEKVSLVSMGVRSVNECQGCHGYQRMSRGVRGSNGIKGCQRVSRVSNCDRVSGV